MQDKSAAGSGFTLRVAASFNPAVNATVRGNSRRALQYLLPALDIFYDLINIAFVYARTSQIITGDSLPAIFLNLVVKDSFQCPIFWNNHIPLMSHFRENQSHLWATDNPVRMHP